MAVVPFKRIGGQSGVSYGVATSHWVLAALAATSHARSVVIQDLLRRGSHSHPPQRGDDFSLAEAAALSYYPPAWLPPPTAGRENRAEKVVTWPWCGRSDSGSCRQRGLRLSSLCSTRSGPAPVSRGPYLGDRVYAGWQPTAQAASA